ncbi:hypothetical protein B0H17DRAFT_1153141 [Mycena rosella]|uniref:Uncharacterized protein n=1 Tax=Mycena rosella TaxID=1033263 RepID=A0AAD7B8I2_MYCRO|nr:hypothetical protein B0H17DRAFT_1153141 [Mycena rosella]
MSRMLHFPSSLRNTGVGGSNSGVLWRSNSLNAMQQKHQMIEIFLTIEQELPRPGGGPPLYAQHGNRMTDLVSVLLRDLSVFLSQAYKSQAELELQIGAAKWNLQLIIMNEEMLEEALKAGSRRMLGGAARAAQGPHAGTSGPTTSSLTRRHLRPHVPFSFSSTLLTYDSARRAHVHPPAPHNARRMRRDVCEFAESRAHAARGLWATVSCSRLGAARLVKTPSPSLRVSPRHSSRSSAAPVTAFVGMALKDGAMRDPMPVDARGESGN